MISLQRTQSQRAKRALERMLEYQKEKAQHFFVSGHDHSGALMHRSLEVRRKLEVFGEIKPDARVLEVGSGAHGLIFFFGARLGIGVDPLAHHYVSLFPQWQRCTSTVSAYGEALPFPDNSFDVVLSDDVVDYADDPEAIVTEIARVLASSGMFYFTVNICHPVWNVLGKLRRVEDFHTTHISLGRAQRFFKGLPLRIVWQDNNIPATRAEIRRRLERRFSAWAKSLFYYKARLVIIAVNNRQDPSRGPSNT